MWYLISENDSRVIYVLPEKEVIIGRSADGQSCNFAVPADPSLSRKHASLCTADNHLHIQDLGSKYGTFINNSTDKLECNKKIILNINDIIKFGKMNCEWKVQKVDLITCTSTLKGENIQNLKIIINQLGGVFKSEWDNTCTYLTMPAITLTIKVVLALVQGSYIVTTDYWTNCLEAISQNEKLPDPANFTPHIVESTLNKETVSFLPDKVRKSIFAGKKMVFFSKRQLEMYRMVLENSSATALLLSEAKMTKSMLCCDDVIVIQYNITPSSQDTEAQRDQIKDIVSYLKGKGKRVVADAEIGLAILYCSIEKYCNPDFNFTMEVMKQPTNQAAKANNVLAVESQNSSQPIIKQENIKIDESLIGKENTLIGSGNDELVMGKRKRNEGEIMQNKKFATEVIATNNSGTKRAADDNDDLQTNPSKKMDTKDEGSFNFIKNTTNTENGEKKLNLIKPMKRKIEQQDDEDDLFNFVGKKAATESNTNSTDYSTNLNNIEDADDDVQILSNSKGASIINEKVDLTALRGAKLSELMEQTSNMEFNNKAMKIIKTEDIDSEDFGSTVVVVRDDLVVKREPLPIKEESETSTLKNFKKFKKVWPLKIQASMSKLSLGVV